MENTPFLICPKKIVLNTTEFKTIDYEQTKFQIKMNIGLIGFF